MWKNRRNAFVIVWMVTVPVVGCSGPISTREKAAMVGTGVGAATGAIIGAAVSHPGAGAAIGGAVGLGAGALVGDHLQREEQIQTEQRRRLQQQQEELDRQRRELDRMKQSGKP